MRGSWRSLAAAGGKAVGMMMNMMSLAAQSAGEAGTAVTGSLARRLLLHVSEVMVGTEIETAAPGGGTTEHASSEAP